MFAIMCRDKEHNEGVVFYGPFNTEEQLNRYVVKHGIAQWSYCTIKLHDSSECLDA